MTLRAVRMICICAVVACCGCAQNDPPVDETGDCEVQVTSPVAGEIYEVGDDVNIRWVSSDTGGTMNVELLKGGVPVGSIAANTADDRFTFWYAELLGAVSGEDFSVRVSSAADGACVSESGVFSIFNTQNCGFTLTSEEDFLVAGQVLDITWTSQSTTGLVDIELVTWEGIQGVIASGIEDDGSFHWQVTSYHGGGSTFYRIAISDNHVEDCRSESDFITIADSDVCSFEFFNPHTYSVWEVGETVTLSFELENTGDRVDVHLFAGNVYVGLIANNIAADVGTLDWTVTKFGFVGPDHMFRIRISDLDDEYCFGRSEMFQILD